MQQLHLSLLWSDWIVWILFFSSGIFFLWMRTQPHLYRPWRRILKNKLGMIAMVILIFYVATGMIDSIHFQVNSQSKSLLDVLIQPLGDNDEKTYSAPFAQQLFSQDIIVTPDGKEIRAYPKLNFTADPDKIPMLILTGFVIGLMSFIVILFSALYLLKGQQRYRDFWKAVIRGKTEVAWREIFYTFGIIWVILWITVFLAANFHILGTDKVGQDVFYQAIKSIRTGLLIGILTTIFMMPFAIILGAFAGYFRGFIDDIIQYLYTTLSSIPGVLLIAASVLMLQVYIANHPELFPTIAKRADARLLALCFILGITSWASLCRLIRGETLKLRGLEYVQAAQSLGVRQMKIISRHIFPNVMHIVLITLVLDFSGLVLAEAVLSYVGVGVDPTTLSWGNMINSSRLELARDPIVWWPLIAALIFMFVLVLSANLFADSVRDAFDPRLQS